ncbi:MAG: nitroreductase family protein [Spirochaetota bacterium]|nr:MAG: nitroreductase family protein [Spirochaetota bacterium]
MATILDIMKKRRSIRSHSSQPIKKQDMERLVEAAAWAPSAGNSYPWNIVIVQQKQLLRKIQAVSPGMLGNPTALIILCNDREKAQARVGSKGRELFCFMDIAHAAQNICLEATELGIGSCLIMSFNPDAVAELIDLPEPYTADYLISLGYSKGQQVSTKKRTVKETILSWIKEKNDE